MKIPEPKFVLKNPKDDKPTLISFVMRFNNQRVFISTGEVIHPNSWDDIKQRAKNTIRAPQNGDINLWLDKFYSEGKNVFRSMVLDGISPTPELVKSEMDKRLNLKHISSYNTFFGFVEKLIEECSLQKNIQLYRYIY